MSAMARAVIVTLRLQLAMSDSRNAIRYSTSINGSTMANSTAETPLSSWDNVAGGLTCNPRP